MDIKKDYTILLINLKSELADLIKELNISDNEIEYHIHDLISYANNEKMCKQNKDKMCKINHFKFIRDEFNNLKTIHFDCNKQEKDNKIKNNLILCDYKYNNDFKKIVLNGEYDFKNNIKRNHFAKYLNEHFVDNTQIHDCYLYGDINVGKTYVGFVLLRCILNRKPDKKVAYINAKIFCDKTNNSFGNILDINTQENKELYNKYIESLSNVDYLIIDDLGNEKHNSYSLNKLINLLKERIKSNKHTYIIGKTQLNRLAYIYLNGKTNNKLCKNDVNDLIEYIKILSHGNEFEIDKLLK